MGYIKSYFLNIIAVILFTVLVEILMPNNSFRGYIKLVLGLLVVLTVIKPITNIAGFDLETYIPEETYTVSSSDIDDVQNEQINNVFLEQLENHIMADVKNEFNAEISVYIDGDINELRKIIVSGNNVSDEVILHISKTYGVENVTAGGE